ncbi:MAG: glycosyltransferase family 4 protein, partial [Candidatus Paceibacterota bacterium]
MAKFLFTQFQNVELIVENGNPIGGAVVETMVWIKALHELGHEIDQFKFIDDERNRLPDYNWLNLLPVYHPKKGIRWLRWVLYRFPKIFKAMKKNKPDYLYASIPGWSTFYIAVFCKILGIKMILRVASDVMLDDRIKTTHSKFDRAFISRAFKAADFISVQNEFQNQTLKKRFPTKKIFKIYNPIVIDKATHSQKKEMKGYMAWIANFRYPKNLKLLFEVAREFPEETFKIAGVALRSMDSETKEYLSRLERLPNVIFAGKVPREEIFNFLSKAKFLLSTSRYEGFSNTFLEAMVVGTPILTPTLVNPDGIINRFDLGITYENVADLKKSLNELSFEKYLEKSANCNQFVHKNHDHLV